MRQVTGPIWGRYRLTSSADAARKCQRESATTTNQQINGRGNSKAVPRLVQLTHYGDSMPILGNGARVVTAAPRRSPAELDVIRSVDRSRFAISICSGISESDIE